VELDSHVLNIFYICAYKMQSSIMLWYQLSTIMKRILYCIVLYYYFVTLVDMYSRLYGMINFLILNFL